MNNLSNQTYKELAIAYFNEVFLLIDEVLNEHDTSYYLIGVTAIALKLLTDGIKPSRGTKDIDFAIMVPSLDKYQQIMDSLEEKGFNKAKAPWTVYHTGYNVVVDILPFGEIEEKDTVNFNKRYTDLHVLGFKEVLEDAIPIEIETKIASIPPLHGMIILKLIAWSDRPEDRDNDPYDILEIITRYFSLESDEIYTNHYDALMGEDFDQDSISARVLGRKAAGILKKSEKLSSRVLSILNENLLKAENSIIAKKWAKEKDWTLEYALSLLSELKKGIEETLVDINKHSLWTKN